MSGLFTALLASFGVRMGYNLAAVAVSVVSSAVATVFVCFAQDHNALAASHPELWLELMQAWHKAHGPTMQACGYSLS
ncbi:hypothetical protein JKP88DRAFT_281523 [Tribonema minus]|uniref:Uncharacterized protein n=1 Tax=Tribonema minus TaxID=303371 RepID=A0A835YME1_9STRA|nr:hypothetical protein JKP88DRAFT_281523 [Tribonema minus]